MKDFDEDIPEETAAEKETRRHLYYLYKLRENYGFTNATGADKAYANSYLSAEKKLAAKVANARRPNRSPLDFMKDMARNEWKAWKEIWGL